MGRPETLPVGAEDVRDLQPPRPRGTEAHRLEVCRLRDLQEIERRGGGGQMRSCQMEVAHGGAEVPVAQQTLDGVQIHPRLQQMGGEGVPVMPDAA